MGDSAGVLLPCANARAVASASGVVAAKAAATAAAAAAAVNCGDSASCDVEGGWQTLSPERDAVASELAGNVCLGVEQPLAVLAAVLKKTLFIGLKNAQLEARWSSMRNSKALKTPLSEPRHAKHH